MKHDSSTLPCFTQNVFKTKANASLRNFSDFAVPYYRTTLSQNSLDFSIAEVWNKIPKDIKKTDSYVIFKKKSKSWLLQNT